MKATDWPDRIAEALANATLDGLQLYAGDDRLHLARQRKAEEGGLRKAGVLIAIMDGPVAEIVLTERSSSLRSHPGQISFPGGRVEADDTDVQATATREAHEEIGLEPAQVEVLGRLPDYRTGTGYDIAPFVARIPEDARFVPDGREVARVFTVPLAHVLDAANFRRESIAINGVYYKFHVIEYAENYIWGATAAMLYGLRRSVCPAAEESVTSRNRTIGPV